MNSDKYESLAFDDVYKFQSRTAANSLISSLREKILTERFDPTPENIAKVCNDQEMAVILSYLLSIYV